MGNQISPADTWLSHSEDHGPSWNSEWLRDVQEAIKRSHCSGNEEDKLKQLERKTIPTSGEISLFIIAFL
jgi:hypothetical protein